MFTICRSLARASKNTQGIHLRLGTSVSRRLSSSHYSGYLHSLNNSFSISHFKHNKSIQHAYQLVDSRKPLRRSVRRFRRLRRSRPESPRHPGGKGRQLGHRRTLPSKYTTLKFRFNDSSLADRKPQLIHSVALLAIETAYPGKQKIWAKSLLTAGMTMFSGSIYLLVLDPQRFKVMGPVTPLGGTALIAGWIALAIGTRGRIALRS